jgi:transposase InsO family protein
LTIPLTESPLPICTTPHTPADLNWYPDSGASHHITSDLANLNLKAEEYTGSDQLRVGNGNGLSIKHIGHAKIHSPNFSFNLFDVLHVPHIKKNLLSVHQFTKSTNTYFEFHPFNFFVKDRATRKILFHGLSNHGLYSIPPSSVINKPHIPAKMAMVGERTSLSSWHSRLGHPAFQVVRRLLSSLQLPVISNKSSESCTACLRSKSHQLPFSHQHTRSTAPLQLLYTDVWGPSPLISTTGFKFYVSFLDDFSRYSWVFPITCKSDVSTIFIQFQSYVENFFSLKIKSVQSDWGGEYRTLQTILHKRGISHRISCPYTHQQNGAVERKHRHIVETGLALLSHASVPISYWDDAFVTACYLINRMPTSSLQNKSPFEVLFKKSPDYSFLRVFGSACWPNLRPYNSNKLQPRSC